MWTFSIQEESPRTNTHTHTHTHIYIFMTLVQSGQADFVQEDTNAIDVGTAEMEF